MEALEGLHAGEEQYALENSTPLFANRSKLGVLIGPLYKLIQSFKSSTAKKRTLSLLVACFGFLINSIDALIGDIAAIEKIVDNSKNFLRFISLP
jgi:hypothetical protein